MDAVHTRKDIQHHEMELTFPSAASADWFSGVPGAREVSVNNGGRGLRLTVQGDLSGVLQVAAQHGAVNLSTREPSLEEIFLRYYAPEAATAAPVNR